MAFITFGKVNRDIIPILVGCIFCFFSRFLIVFDESILYNHPIIINIFSDSSKIFAIIPLVIAKTRTNEVNKNNAKNLILKEGKYVYLNANDEIKKGKWIYIILSIIIYYIQSCIMAISISIKSNLYVWNLLITSIFCRLIFKINLYRHHYLSIILIILTELILDLISENLQNDINNNLFYVFLRFISEILSSLNDMLDKYLFERKFVNIYEIIL